MKIKNVISKLHNSYGCKKISSRRISTSYISLFLVVLLITTTTVSWFTIADSAKVNSEAFTMESSSGLRVNDGEDLKNHIRLDDMVLAEASSVDGRNMYFPLEGNFSSTTTNMTFREGNVGDRNKLYAYKDFTLKGDSGVTNVYIKSYSIKVNRKLDDGSIVSEVFDGSTKITYNDDGYPVAQEKHAECPIRISFITDSADAPVVIDPSALIKNYVTDYDAIYTTVFDGTPITQTTDASTLSEYYYGSGRPLFTLMGTEPIDVSMVVWLEGTSSACDQYAGQNVSIELELESNYDNMEYITFVDRTIGDDSPATAAPSHWIGNKAGGVLMLMTYTDTDNSKKTVIMQESSDTTLSNPEWFAPIPVNVTTEISFMRYNIAEEEIYNAWHTFPGINAQLTNKAKKVDGWVNYFGELQESRVVNGERQLVYTAIRGNGWGKVEVGTVVDGVDWQTRRLQPGLGYWGFVEHSDTPTTQPTQATVATVSTQATTQPVVSGDTITIGSISLGNLKQWVVDNLETPGRGYTLYIELRDGTLIPMSKAGDRYYKAENVTVKKYSVIKSFTIKSANNTQYLALVPEYTINSNINLSFNMKNENENDFIGPPN